MTGQLKALEAENPAQTALSVLHMKLPQSAGMEQLDRDFGLHL